MARLLEKMSPRPGDGSESPARAKVRFRPGSLRFGRWRLWIGLVGTSAARLAHGSRRGALVAALILALAGSCAPRPAEETSLTPPFRAQYGDLILDVPDRPDLFQARKYSFGLTVTVCERGGLDSGTRPLCEKLTAPVVNDAGLYTLVTAPQTGRRFSLLKERPERVREPGPAALAPVPPDRIDTNILNGTGEAYELSRLSVLTRDAPLLTTINGWPLARCDTGPLGNRYCAIGFLIRGAFVETRVYAESGVALDQKEVWDVASALDEKLRELSPEPAHKPPSQ